MVNSMSKKIKLIYGVGINDADYNVTKVADSGQEIRCQFYRRWTKLLERCYSTTFHKKQTTYAGCFACNDWLTFSNFKAWMEKQDWQGKELDKDILIKGNKVYSPETCAFVSAMTNSFLIERVGARGDWPIGVHFIYEISKFKSQCSNPFTKKNESLGLFLTPDDAHLAWKKRKHELACQLADLQTDERVANALRLRYAS